MKSKKGDTTRSAGKILHDVRSHLSVILSASELALLDEATTTREAALSVIKTTTAEVNSITRLLEEIRT